MRWVVFDIGGVLARIRTDWYECARVAEIQSASKLAHSQSRKISDFELFDPYQQGLIPTEPYLEELARFLGGVPPETAGRVHDAILIEPYPGTEEIVDALNTEGIGTACLSNTNARHWPVLTSSGRFPNIEKLRLKVGSHDVGLAKPSPEIYRKFEELSGATPGQILYFEDHPEYAAAARALWWNAELVDPDGDPAAQIATKLREASLLDI